MVGLRSCPVGDPTVGPAQSTAAVSGRPRRPAAHRELFPEIEPTTVGDGLRAAVEWFKSSRAWETGDWA